MKSFALETRLNETTRLGMAIDYAEIERKRLMAEGKTELSAMTIALHRACRIFKSVNMEEVRKLLINRRNERN